MIRLFPIFLRFRRSLLVVGLAVAGPALTSSLSAQPQTAPSASAQRIFVHLLPLPETPHGAASSESLKLRHFIAGKLQPLELVPGQNPAVTRPATQGLKLYPFATPTPASAEAKPPAPLAEVDFPASWQTVLVLAASSHGGGTLRLKAYNIGEDVVPVGKITFLNQTNAKLAGRLLSGPRGVHGKVDFVVSSGATVTQDAKVRPNDDTQAALMTLMREEPGATWTKIAQETIALDRKARTLAILFPSGPNAVQAIWFIERPPASPEPPTASR